MLEARGLNKGFGGIQAVNDASFDIEEGTITSLIGPNGAGKTTTFNLINNVIRADSGSVKFEGTEITRKMPHKLTRLGIGRTFQVTRALDDMTVIENMVVGSSAENLRGTFGSRMLDSETERALDLLAFVGIEKYAYSKAELLSYGQRKLLEFSAVLMSKPRLVMLDEPAGGVNPALLERMVDRIRRLNGEGLTFFIVEHNMDLVMDLSDSVIVMAHGEVLTRGTPEEVQSDGRVLDAYLGMA
ncbi:MAG: ABC transporter ATP-binding protein [Actinobacteria bacterium]|nr:ABC transporter ATP-binding protein [Actinomycetota bacterium]